MTDAIRDRLHLVRQRIARAARASGRDPADVKLIAVSKTKPASMVREAFEAGQRAFGENYAQELLEKAAELGDLVGLEWHFIGHLQSNKARQVVKVAHVVHTVDSAPLAREIGKRAAQGGASCAVLVEVNVGREPQKFGVLPEDMEAVVAAVESQPALVLRGLMTVPPADGDSAAQVFAALATLRTVLGGPSRLPELSMGMSGDLESAVAAGATMVRIGSAIFGER